MGTGHHHQSPGARHRGRLAVVLALLVLVGAVEVAVGLASGSLVLLSDAGHVATDALGVAIALATVHAANPTGRVGRVGRVGVRARRRTYGLYRLEVLGALANAVLLGGLGCVVLVAAVRRLTDPPAVSAPPVLVTAAVGLAVNVLAWRLLRTGAAESVSVRGASLEVAADAFASLGTIAAAALTWATGWRYADPLAAAAVAVLILPRAYGLGRATLRILLEAAPRTLDPAAVSGALGAVPGVTGVHDLHLWTVTTGMDVATAHLDLAPDADPALVLARAREVLEARGVRHATLQLEPSGATGCCTEMGW